ncbi:MAG: hypothetical protein ACLP5H_13465, partial [Desulfomonilaceae bacterium]
FRKSGGLLLINGYANTRCEVRTDAGENCHFTEMPLILIADFMDAKSEDENPRLFARPLFFRFCLYM